MSMRPAMGLTYGEIWNEYRMQGYPQVSEYELLAIHKRWKALGASVWKATSPKP